MTAGSWLADDSAPVGVKNTFIHLKDDSESEEESPRSQRRRFSVPPSIRLAGITALKTSTESEVSSCAGSCDVTVAGDKESASPGSTAANTPLASPRQRRQSCANAEEEPLPPPDPPPQPASQVCSPARTRLSAKAARWQPAGSDGAEQLVDRQVALVADQLQATLDHCGAQVKIEIHGAERCQRCLVLWIRPEDSWMTERLLTAAKEAFLFAGESDRVFVLGHQGRPFAPQMHGFSAMLVAVEEKTQACWEMLKRGSCCRGTACRWQHPMVAYPVNVVVVRQTESLLIQRTCGVHGITPSGLRGGHQSDAIS